MMKALAISVVIACVAFAAYAEEGSGNQSGTRDLAAQIELVLQERPEILLKVLEDNPIALANLVERAAYLRSVQAEEERWQAELRDPRVPVLDDDRPVRGVRDAPVTIVEYSDFECPYCQAASTSLMRILENYEGRVKLVYRHNPLPFHPSAEPAARYFEAIALQDHAQAWLFHDRVFEQQEDLAEGTGRLQQIAATLELDQQRLAADLDSEIVSSRLKADAEEAERFGFDGTPAFVINGVSIIGNQPMQDFERIIALFL